MSANNASKGGLRPMLRELSRMMNAEIRLTQDLVQTIQKRPSPPKQA